MKIRTGAKLERRKEKLTGLRKRPDCEVENSGRHHSADVEIQCNLFSGAKIYFCNPHSEAYHIAEAFIRRLTN